MVATGVAFPTIDVEVIGDGRIVRTMEAWAFRAAHPQPVLSNMAEFRQMENERQFDSEGSYGGHPWEALKDQTLARKQRGAVSDDRILHASLRLRDSLTGKTDDTLLEIDHKGFALGTKVPYAGAMQEGVEGHNTPARPFLVERHDTGVIMGEMLQTWIIGRAIINKAKRGEL